MVEIFCSKRFSLYNLQYRNLNTLARTLDVILRTASGCRPLGFLGLRFSLLHTPSLHTPHLPSFREERKAPGMHDIICVSPTQSRFFFQSFAKSFHTSLPFRYMVIRIGPGTTQLSIRLSSDPIDRGTLAAVTRSVKIGHQVH